MSRVDFANNVMKTFEKYYHENCDAAAVEAGEREMSYIELVPNEKPTVAYWAHSNMEAVWKMLNRQYDEDAEPWWAKPLMDEVAMALEIDDEDADMATAILDLDEDDELKLCGVVMTFCLFNKDRHLWRIRFTN